MQQEIRNIPQTDSGVITLAYGISRYIEMAKTLARSLRLHSPEIPRAIVTDTQDDKELIELFDDVIPLRKEYGSNLRQKLHLDKYSPYEKTVYIDSDCIAVRDVNFIFEQLEGRSFSVPGENLLRSGHKDSFIDVDFVLAHFGLEALPQFNGGLLYFDKSKTANLVFDKARDILNDWKKLGFSEWRSDGPNDERIFAIAMTLHKETMFQDQGQMMCTPIGLKSNFDIDVFTGKSTFQKYDRIVSPAVVHFACVWGEHPVYFREVSKLKNIPSGKENNIKSGIFSPIKYRFGYQIAFVRYLIYRVPKKPKYFISMAKRVWKKVFS